MKDEETRYLKRVDESQRHRHGVTAATAIVVDVVGARTCLFVRPSVRSFVRLLDGV